MNDCNFFFSKHKLHKNKQNKLNKYYEKRKGERNVEIEREKG